MLSGVFLDSNEKVVAAAVVASSLVLSSLRDKIMGSDAPYSRCQERLTDHGVCEVSFTQGELWSSASTKDADRTAN